MTPFALALALALPPAAAQQPPDPPPEAGEPLPLTKMPELVAFTEAPYPPAAQEAGLEETVTLILEITAEGLVEYAAVPGPEFEAADGTLMTSELGLEELDDESDPNGFARAAIAAAMDFRFSPAEDATGSVPVIIEFAYSFELAPPEPEDLTPADLPVTLEGVVVEMGTSRELPEMGVVVLDAEGGETEYLGTTDEAGAFAIRGVPPGTWIVRVARPGWEVREFEVEIVEGEVTQAKVWIKNLDYAANEAVGLYRKETEEVTRRTISVQEVRRVPGTFGDPVRVIQSLPGAARSPFGTGVLIIRGSNPEDSGVYVEGIRIPLIYHLGGYVSVIAPELIESVDYLPGGYGVQYGRSLGGVIDVSIKEEAPEKHRISWSTDLLDSGGLYEGRVGKRDQHHIGLAARRSYIDLILAPINEASGGFVAKPRWADYQLRYHNPGSDASSMKVTAFVFGFSDKLLVSTPDNFAQGTDADTQGDIGVEYGTHRALVKLEKPLGDDWTLRFIPSFGVDYSYTGIGSAIELEITQYLPEIRLEVPWEPSEHLTVTPGVDFIGGVAQFAFSLPFDIDNLTSYDPIGEREGFSESGSQTGWGPDLYLKAAWRPLADPERLLILPGVRMNIVSLPGQYTVAAADPRLTFRAQLTGSTAIKGGTGLYHQPPQPFESYRPDGAGVQLDFERAWANAVGLEQQLTAAASVEIEGFYKTLDSLIVTNPEIDSEDDQYFVNDGVGRIYGMEVMLRQAPLGKVFGWISYTLSRSERSDDPEADPEGWYVYDFDQTHILVAVAGYRLPWNMEVSGRLQHVTGNPYTPYSGGVYDMDQDFYFGYTSGERNSERLPPYTALDLRWSKRFVFKRGWFELYADFLNAYRGENPEFVLDNYDYTESRYIRGLPFIPSPGFSLEWNF